MSRRISILGLALGLALLGSAAHAQVAIAVSPTAAPTLGKVVQGSTATTFSISTAGAVTRSSGNAIRLSSAAVTAPTVTLSCGLLNLNSLCAIRVMRVTVAPSGASGTASISKLRVGSLTGATFKNGTPAEASSLTFDLNPMGIASTASFKVGMDVLVPAGTAASTQTFNYTVTATLQ